MRFDARGQRLTEDRPQQLFTRWYGFALTFPDTGILAGGFARFRCERCRHEHLLPFSCKSRAICPSCGGRRMAERAAHLVDYVFPVVPVRQRGASGPRAVGDPVPARTHRVREPGDPVVACDDEHRRPHREVYGRTAMMDDRGKSDRSVVPTQPPNNAGPPAGEVVEGSGLAKGNSLEGRDGRTPRRTQPSAGIERVRQAARRARTQRFTARMHHVDDVNRRRVAYVARTRDAAAGIDGETWKHDGDTLEDPYSDRPGRRLGCCSADTGDKKY